MLQFVSVTKQYSPEIAALEEVSFEINEGEFAFLVGPSGSGKTTIIRLLIREESPSAGKIYFDNEDVTKYNRSKIYRLRRKIGVIFQDFKLIPELTAFENVAFAMEAAGRSEKEIKENVPYLLDIVNLSNRVNSFPSQLSGGEKQRVAIARAMANNPKLLIADEPTGNLDPESAWDVVQILSKINNWGTTVIMSTHGSDIVNTLHKRVLRLENGHLVRDDFKGGYHNVDEFSLKILNAQSNTKATVTTDGKNKDIEEKLKKENKLKQTKSNKKITFATKKSKLKIPEETEKPQNQVQTESAYFENKMLNNIDKDIKVENKSSEPIAESPLKEDLKKKLGEIGVITIDDLKINFKEKIQDNKDFTKDDKKTLQPLIKTK